jgi:hypothetical protein
MSKESIAIRFRNTDSQIIVERQKKVFENQIPGKYVIDVIGNTYFCTKSKTEKGEPVWQRISNATQTAIGNYILVNFGDSLTSASSIITGTQNRYTISAVNKRMNTGSSSLYSKAAFGTYVFISVSDSTNIPSSPSGTTTGIDAGSTVQTDSALISSLVNAKQETEAMSRWLAVDSNNRSSFGATSTVTPAKEATLSPEQAALYRGSRYGASPQIGSNPSAPPNARGGSAGGNSSSPSRTPNSPSKPTVIINFLPDKNIYNGDTTYSEYADMPHIQQTITVFNSSDRSKPTRQRIVRRHVFEIVPNSFEFSQLSSTWNDVERSGNFPMVDWAKYNLTKCSFRFLIAGRRTDTISVGNSQQETLVNDGLDVSVDEQIENLRAMAGAPYPVIFNNFNTLLSTSFRFPYLENTRGIQWVIADLSITATRLTPNGKKIAAAEVSITLNEYPVISRDIVPLPALAPDRPVPKQCKPKPCKNPKPRIDELYTSGYAYLQADYLSTPEALD